MATTHIKGSRVALKCALPSPSSTPLPRTKTIFWQLIWFWGPTWNKGLCPFYLCNFNLVAWILYKKQTSVDLIQRAGKCLKLPESSGRAGDVGGAAPLSDCKTASATHLCQIKIGGEGKYLITLAGPAMPCMKVCTAQAGLCILEHRHFTQTGQPGCQSREKGQDTSPH